MIVNEAIFVPLGLLYNEYNKAKNTKEHFYNKNRKKIKVLVDALSEQLVEELLGSKPRNALDARKIINSELVRIKIKEDIALLEALQAVLKQYEVLSDKAYIDHSRKMEDVFNGAMRDLCWKLTIHSRHEENAKARALKTALRGT